MCIRDRGIILVSGYTRQTHLGQAAFVGIGAYVSAVLMIRFGWNFWITIPCAILLAALLGFILAIPTLKLTGGPYLAMVTQIFGEMIFIIILNWESVTGGSFGINRIPAPMIGSISFKQKKSLLYLVAVAFLIAFFVAWRLVKSKYGRFFLSIKESEAAAQSVGINTMKYKIVAFVFSSGFGGLAGVFYAQCFGYLSPDQFQWPISLTLMSMAIIGGLSRLEGGVLGAVIVTILPELLRGFTAQSRMIVYGALVILTLLFLPEGIISLIGKRPSEIKEMFQETMKSFRDERSRRKRKSLKDGKTY